MIAEDDRTPGPSEAELAERFGERLRVFAARRLADASAAEDAAQEALRRVVEALRAGRIENLLAMPAFVFQTALHVCLQYNRSRRRESRALWRLAKGAPENPSGTLDALSELITEERKDAVLQALEELGQGDRELLRMLYYEGVDRTEIARRLSVTPEALRVRKHRALRRLGELLGDEEGRKEEGRNEGRRNEEGRNVSGPAGTGG